MYLKLRNPLAVFDVETTGLSVAHDRIVEISIIKLMPNGEQKHKTLRINPGMPIPAEVSMIHGIYDEDVQQAPSFKQVAKELAEFLKGADLGGFNVMKLDIPILIEEFLRAGISFDVSQRKIVDAQKIFHLMEPRTLSAAYRFYCNKSLENAHSAEADTIATLEVLEAQVARYEGVEVEHKDKGRYVPIENDMATLHTLSMHNMVDLAGRMVYNSQGTPVFNFGKYKDKPVLEVIKRDPAYYDWMQNGDFPLNTKQKLTEIKLSEFGKK